MEIKPTDAVHLGVHAGHCAQYLESQESNLKEGGDENAEQIINETELLM